MILSPVRSKIVAICILFLFSLQLAGSYIVFFGWKYLIQCDAIELAATQPDSALIHLSFTKDNSKDNELCYKGKMYDVIRTKSNGNKTDYYCVRDFEEEQLASGIEVEWLQQAKDTHHKAIQLIVKSQSELFDMHPVTKKISETTSNFLLSVIPKVYFSSFFLLSPTPPPRIS